MGIDLSKQKCYTVDTYNVKGCFMAANYNKLWKLLIDKGMSKTDLRVKTGMSSSTLAKMGNNETVSMDVIFRICDVLDCNVGDVMDAIKKD